MRKKPSQGRSESRAGKREGGRASGGRRVAGSSERGVKPARTSGSGWDDFDRDTSGPKSRSAAPRGEGAEREKRPYQRRDDRDSGGEREKRPYQRREDSGDRGGFGDREKRPYQRRDDRDDSNGFAGRGEDKRQGRGAGGSYRPSADERHAHFEKKYAARGGKPAARTRRKNASEGPDLTGEIRLNRFISMAGIASRREADELITAGLIMVNGELITELGTKVRPGDDVRYNGERIRNEKHVYILLNKPKDYITTADDPEERQTVMELIAGACKERVYPVGRLDRNTTGLLLFTNDGDLAKHLTHPSSRVKKIYHVELDKNVKVADMRRLQEGVELEDGISSVDDVSFEGDGSNKKSVGVELHSGKNRVVRRLFEALGYEVKKLDRVGFAGLTKKDLPRGRWRVLDEREVGFLKMMGTGKKAKAV